MKGAPRIPCVVVKLGGSLADDPSLADWLRELGRGRLARFAVVPGGGPFADTVRAAQGVWRFSDEVAHMMAISAMDQFGRVLCAIEGTSIPCSTLPQIEDAWAGGRLPVWLPGHLMSRDRQLVPNWDVTSDTIAAWLAVALGTRALLLVKSCDLPVDHCDPAGLAGAGIVDPCLPEFLSRNLITLQVVQKNRWSDLKQIVTRLP